MLRTSAVGLFAGMAMALSAYANDAEPFPPPKITLEAAVRASQAAFTKHPLNAHGGYFAMSARYMNTYSGIDSGWAWYVEFSHPVRNSKIITYRLDAQGEALFFAETE